MTRRALGVDLASAAWASNGSAVVEFDDAGFTRVRPGAIDWPPVALTPRALAEAIDAFARSEGVRAVALDGPQGWRDPATPEGTPGVGRRCEYLCRAQAKTGVRPRTYPGNQRPWIEFSIEVFTRLLSRPGVRLADPASLPTDRAPADTAAGYALLECFPTSAWRSSGLAALPGKRRKPDLAPFLAALAAAYRLPETPVTSHDDLQAIVAALAAAAAAGGPAVALPLGVESSPGAGPAGPLRLEGFIWNVAPR